MSAQPQHPVINVQSLPKAFPLARIRKDFPILDQRVNGRPRVYLDNAATAHKPRVVMDAETRV